MIAFIKANIGSIIVGIVLVILVALAIKKLVKNKKNGTCSCGDSCAGCTANCPYSKK